MRPMHLTTQRSVFKEKANYFLKKQPPTVSNGTGAIVRAIALRDHVAALQNAKVREEKGGEIQMSLASRDTKSPASCERTTAWRTRSSKWPAKSCTWRVFEKARYLCPR